MCPESREDLAGYVSLKARRSGGFMCPESAWKTPRNHSCLWKRPSRCLWRLCVMPGKRGEGCPRVEQRSWPIPGGVNGIFGATRRPFQRSGLAEPEAFLARWLCVVHLLAQNEEPAQRPGCSRGGILDWVRDVGFRFCSHSGTRVSRLQQKHRHLAAILGYGTRVSGGIAGVDGNRTNAPLFSPRLPRSIRYSKA